MVEVKGVIPNLAMLPVPIVQVQWEENFGGGSKCDMIVSLSVSRLDSSLSLSLHKQPSPAKYPLKQISTELTSPLSLLLSVWALFQQSQTVISNLVLPYSLTLQSEEWAGAC